jgi:hypothetical protein
MSPIKNKLVDAALHCTTDGPCVAPLTNILCAMADSNVLAQAIIDAEIDFELILRQAPSSPNFLSDVLTLMIKYECHPTCGS